MLYVTLTEDNANVAQMLLAGNVINVPQGLMDLDLMAVDPVSVT